MSAIATSDSKGLQIWSSQSGRLQVRCADALIRRINGDVIEAFGSIPRGGLEIGGVLFGVHDPDSVTIVAVRPISCEHRFGPGFRLSDTDEAALTEMLARDQEADAELGGLEPVGWVHSHTRSDVDLTEEDAYFHTKYFGKPWQIALILRPEPLRPTRAALYVPEEDGRLRTGPPENIFEISSGRAVQAATPEAAVTVMDSPAELVAPLDVDTPVEVLTPLPPPRPGPHRWLVALCALVAGFVAAAAYSSIRDSSAAPQPSDIALRISGTGEQLTITWMPPRNTYAADLEIRDGLAEPQYVHLTPQQLSGGRLTYVRRNPDVNMRMRLYGASAAPADFVASFLGPPIRKGSAASADLAPTPVAASIPPATVAASGQPSLDAPKPAVSAPTAKIAVETGERARLDPAVAQVAMQIPAAPAVTPPPSIVVNPDLRSAPATLTPVAPRPLPEAPPRVVERRPPATGRAIWTGILAPGATLTIEGGRASSGSLTGVWPRRPARISAHVADLSDAGIVVYTQDPAQRPRVGTSESPSARNGWNATIWRWDEKRGGVRILDAPGPHNNWNRLTVRGDAKKVSMLIVEWEELPAAASP